MKYVVDWAATGSMIQGLGTITGAIAVLAAARLGQSTFESWKRQKIVERHIDQAERVLTASYNARRALKYVRGVMMWSHELSKAEDDIKEFDWIRHVAEEKKKRLITTQAYYNRLNNTKTEQEALNACRAMARALFGEELENSIEKLNHQFWVVQVDAESYSEDVGGTDAEFSKKIRRGMYDVKAREGETNEVTDEIENAIASIEAICLPILRVEQGK